MASFVLLLQHLADFLHLTQLNSVFASWVVTS
jgi:hypothetical protein